MEAHIRANRFGLLKVDRAEAIGNIETGLSGVLNSFHNLYDAIQKQMAPAPINWYESAPLALMLVLRNARHHNHANRIRTLYSHYLQEASEIGTMESYILIDFPCPEDGANTFDLHVSWGDLKHLFDLPKKDTQIKDMTRSIISDYLSTSKFREYAELYKLPESKLCFNIIPLFVNAAATITPFIKDHCEPDSSEARFFAEHFCSLTKADTQNHEVDCGPVAFI
ncbi:hypothetical protein [Flavobacterium agri]|nr:hypothetical protein [Flavobacterium agri]